MQIRNSSIREWINQFRQIKKENYRLVTEISTALSAVINIAFMVFNGAMGVVYLSLWNGSICVYYLLLGLVRTMIVLAGRKRFSEDAERTQFCRKVYIRTHLLLLLMDAAMVTPIAVMARGGREFTYGLIPAIAMAAYTTYRITMAIRHFIKTRKSDNILISELKLINLTDALLALLTLQNALIIANGGFTGGMKTLTMWSSAGIIAAILCLTILSLRKVKSMK